MTKTGPKISKFSQNWPKNIQNLCKLPQNSYSRQKVRDLDSKSYCWSSNLLGTSCPGAATISSPALTHRLQWHTYCKIQNGRMGIPKGHLGLERGIFVGYLLLLITLAKFFFRCVSTSINHKFPPSLPPSLCQGDLEKLRIPQHNRVLFESSWSWIWKHGNMEI